MTAWLSRWLDQTPELRPFAERWLGAAQAVRELCGEAFAGPLEPEHPKAVELTAKLEELATLARRLEAEPTRELFLQALQGWAELEAESFFLAATRPTAGPVARAALAQAVNLARHAWQELERQAAAQGIELPWRLELATHVAPELEWGQARLAGNAVAGLPLASWPWGERCAVTGRWFQEDGAGAPRFRSLASAFYALAPEAFHVLSHLREAWQLLAELDPEFAEGLASGFPALADGFSPELWSNTFASLGLASPPSLAVTLNNALVRFSHRPLFANVWEGRWLSYAEVRRQALGLAKALAEVGLSPGTRVAVAVWRPGFASYLVDFAGVFAGLVTVGLDHAWPRDRALEALARAQVQAVVGDAEGLERVAAFPGPKYCLAPETAPGAETLETAEPDEAFRTPSGVSLATPAVLAEDWEAKASAFGLPPDTPESLYTVVFTSGSTGAPKPVPITRHRMRQQQFKAHLWPLVIASFQPYALLADRRAVWQAVLAGGRVGFCRRGSELWEDLQRLAPTYLEGPPGLFQPLINAYRHALARGATPSELARLRLELRRRVGGRVAALAVGGAPVPADLPPLLGTVFQAPVQEAYGTTETGTLAQGGYLRPGLGARLVDRPELGLTSADKPFPRGELAVKLPQEQARLLALGSDRLTADGFYLTGDLVELAPDGRIRVLGRTGELVKLTDGRFLLPSQAEAAVLATGLAHQVALVAAAGKPLLVVVPGPDVDSRDLREKVARTWAKAFPGRPCPDVLVDIASTPWTPENGLLTSSGKPNRPALARFYAGQANEAPSGLSESDDPAESVLLTIARILGRSPSEFDDEKPLLEQGLDSLAAAEILALADARGAKLEPAALRTWPLSQLLEHLAASSPEAAAGEALPTTPVCPPTESAEDEAVLQTLRIPLPSMRPPFNPQGLTLLTGATGFLGVHLLAELSASPPAGGPVVALVRARDDAHGVSRLREALARARLPTLAVGRWGESASAVWAVACDLASPHLGLDPTLYRRLAEEVAVIVHAAASVRHLASFSELVGDNVEPLRHLLRLAVTSRLKAFHLVSSLDVTRLASAAGAGGREEAPLPSRLGDLASQAGGYALSKWAAERMVELEFQHLEGTWPVVVSRPGLVSWSKTTGFANLKEWFPAIFASCLELAALPNQSGAAFPPEPVLTETSARGLQPLPVDFLAEVLARLTTGLVTMAAQGKAALVRLNLVNTNSGTAGLSLWPQLFAFLQAAWLAETRRTPLASCLWRDFRDLCLARKTPFAPLVPAFPELPALPRFPAPTMDALLGDSRPPAWGPQLFR
ncbi:MAG: SDR family oxidoreductase, partial [Thermoanaerobaculum sp.]